jgi:N-acyl homoserine lactone hydrolase
MIGVRSMSLISNKRREMIMMNKSMRSGRYFMSIISAAALMICLISPSLAFGASGIAKVRTIRLYVMDCGVLLYNNLERFGYKKGELKQTNLSNGCYLILHPDGRSLVWDTGVVPDDLWKRDGIPPKKEYAEAIVSLDSQLMKLALSPNNITYVTVSHAHWDHVANLYQFSHDTWLTSQYTRDKLLSKDPPDHTDPKMFEKLRDTKTVILPDDKNYDVFGDGSVTIIPTPGHTPDSRVLLIRLKKTGPVILSGDLYHFRQDIKTNNTLPNENRPQSLKSRALVEQLMKKIHAKLWINHDYNEFHQLRKSPAYYD